MYLGEHVTQTPNGFVSWVYGVATDAGERIALNVDEAALNLHVLPCRMDGFECAAGAVSGHDERFGNFVEEFEVFVGAFPQAPMPGNNVVFRAGYSRHFLWK